MDEPDFARQRELFAKVLAGDFKLPPRGPRPRRRPTGPTKVEAATPASGQ